jgi:drug/metabolite transporter (DMT)-like permease
MTVAQLLFAMMAAGGRLAGRTVPWQEVCASRFLVGALTAYIVARARGQSLRIVRVREAWLRSAFGTLAAGGTFFLYAAKALALGDAATVLATAPIFVALLSAPLLGERVRPGLLVALLLGFAGIALIARPSFGSAGHLVAIGIATAISSAMAMVWLRRIGPSETSEAIVLHFSGVGAVVMLILSLPVWQTPDARELVVLGLVGFCAGLAQLSMTRAYSRDHAARVSALGYSGVVFTRALAMPIFGEVPDATQAVGSLLVIASGVLLAFGRMAVARLRGPG